MTPKEKAEALVNSYRIILMNEDTECGNEILCTSIAKQCALIAVDEMQQLIKDLSSCKNRFIYIIDEMNYWIEVKKEIENL
jgi:alpha-L-arabinofuranosidase